MPGIAPPGRREPRGVAKRQSQSKAGSEAGRTPGDLVLPSAHPPTCHGPACKQRAAGGARRAEDDDDDQEEDVGLGLCCARAPINIAAGPAALQKSEEAGMMALRPPSARVALARPEPGETTLRAE